MTCECDILVVVVVVVLELGVVALGSHHHHLPHHLPLRNCRYCTSTDSFGS